MTVEDLLFDRGVDRAIALRATRVLRIPRNRWKRLFAFATLRARLAFVALAVRRQHAARTSTYVVLPDLESPTFVYERGTPAERYARTRLGLHQGRLSLVRRAVEALAGCDYDAGAVVVAGRES